ncbi:MAG: hypothetical protein K6F39_00645 [Lachnospiraceae bacterium]|nr:hypothetical protein [Lachnospiraceae bacterium]
MQSCDKCKIEIRGNKARCPLCGGKLKGEPESPAFPALKRKIITRALLVRIAAFILFVFCLAMRIVDYASPAGISWLPLAIISAFVGFGDICVMAYYHNNPLKTITIQIYVGMFISLIVDYYTGWHAWSVVWVLPGAFCGMVIATIITGLILRMRLQDFVLYLLFDTLFALVQFVFLFKEINPFPLPAVISTAMIIVFFVGILLFRWRDFASASSRYFNT